MAGYVLNIYEVRWEPQVVQWLGMCLTRMRS